MARALGTSTRGRSLALKSTSPGDPGPDLARVLALVEQAYQESSRAFWADVNAPDAPELSALATLLLGIGQIIRRGRQPGMTVALGGVEGGGGLSIAAVPKVVRVGGVVVPFALGAGVPQLGGTR